MFTMWNTADKCRALLQTSGVYHLIIEISTVVRPVQQIVVIRIRIPAWHTYTSDLTYNSGTDLYNWNMQEPSYCSQTE